MLVPEVYIKKRWTKKAKCRAILDGNDEKMQADFQKSLTSRYTDLCHLSLKLSSKAAVSIKTYQIAKRNIEMTLKELENVAKEDVGVPQPDMVGIANLHLPVELVKNIEGSKHIVSQENQTLSSSNQMASCNPPCAKTSQRPAKRIMLVLDKIQREGEAKMGLNQATMMCHLCIQSKEKFVCIKY